MYICMIAAECAPMAKAGGLGDVVHGLSRELIRQGHEVEIMLPGYDCITPDSCSGTGAQPLRYEFRFRDEPMSCRIQSVESCGLLCHLVTPESEDCFFERGRLYGEPDDPERFTTFCRASLEFILKRERQPDILHCHDWHTGLVPVLLYEEYTHRGLTRPRVCYTLHNLGHQGIAAPRVLSDVGLDPHRVLTSDRLRHDADPALVNLMKGGIVYSNFVTTVSPRHAEEVQHTELGCGLQRTLRTHGAKFGGILNGVDYDTWSPEGDPWIPRQYSSNTLGDKYHNTTALRTRLRMALDPKPLVAVVSRLDRQKGAPLIRHTIDFVLAHGAQFVLLGSATETALHETFRDIKVRTADNPDCHLELHYDEALAHGIYAAADLLVIPSVYEPCGLTQLIAMKYGVVPVVRNTGGLGDTVFDANYSNRDFLERNGYVFQDYTTQALESALTRALGLWFDHPDYFRQLRLNAMRCDFSWTEPAERYGEIYESLVD